MENQRVLIKKYENRRLYDATNSRYVNLEEVAQFVQQGYDVQVVDAASGEDSRRLIPLKRYVPAHASRPLGPATSRLAQKVPGNPDQRRAQLGMEHGFRSAARGPQHVSVAYNDSAFGKRLQRALKSSAASVLA